MSILLLFFKFSNNCDSSVNCWFGIILLLIADLYARCRSNTGRLLSKIYKTLTQFQFEVHPIMDFYQSQIHHVITYQKLFFQENFSQFRKSYHVESRFHLVCFEKYIVNLLFLQFRLPVPILFAFSKWAGSRKDQSGLP